MKISKIYIKGFHQFQKLELDFTNPKTNLPVDKICFIGRNGTGKTKLLELIEYVIHESFINTRGTNPLSRLRSMKGSFLFRLYFENSYYYYYFPINRTTIGNPLGKALIFEEKDPAVNLIIQRFNSDMQEDELLASLLKLKFTNQNEVLKALRFKNNSSDLFIYSASESLQNQYSSIKDVPDTTLDEALKLTGNFNYYHIVSPDTIKDFWKVLIYHLKKRDEEREKFEILPGNINKTKAQLIEEFDTLNPKILNSLAKIWDKILNKAGLEFDFEGANNPIQLNDRLKAYIRLKGSKEKINYNELSTGIRNFIFRIGHIYSLYFNREIDRGFLLVDEPENSLYPDFLFDLIEAYQQIIVDRRNLINTQMFFATHNPIIAAQFQPYERIILDWQGDGTVSTKQGYSPVGDDPNDILTNDFELKNLMGPEGRRVWDEYENLKKKLIRSTDKAEKEKLIEEINKIGSLYNFS
jgi:predicted ATP-dependent endonuclease of OLD family